MGFNILVVLATKWKDASNIDHVEYDQRPDVFRYDIYILYTFDLYGIH